MQVIWGQLGVSSDFSVKALIARDFALAMAAGVPYFTYNRIGKALCDAYLRSGGSCP